MRHKKHSERSDARRRHRCRAYHASRTQTAERVAQDARTMADTPLVRGDFEGVADCGADKLADMMGEGEQRREWQANESNVNSSTFYSRAWERLEVWVMV